MVARKAKTKKRPIRNVLGPALRKVREARGWSQGDVAAMLQRLGWSVDRTLVTKIEARRRCLSDYELFLFLRILKISLAELPTPKTQDLLARTAEDFG